MVNAVPLLCIHVSASGRGSTFRPAYYGRGPRGDRDSAGVEGGREGGGEDPRGAAVQEWEGSHAMLSSYVRGVINFHFGKGIVIRFLFRLISHFSTSVNWG
jgi:hypothetical protein